MNSRFTVTKSTNSKDSSFIEYKNQFDRLHREDGPARHKEDFSQYTWFFDGKRHRINVPADKDKPGNLSWFFKDQIHRIGGPAFQGGYNNHKLAAWWRMNKRHRLNAPAVVYKPGTGYRYEYYEFGIHIKYSNFPA